VITGVGFRTGGNVRVTTCTAGKRRGIPVVIHESDSVMGNSNRKVARFAAHICRGFATHSEETFAAPVTHTGNPIRDEMSRGSKEEALRITGHSGSRPILLVVGGSQGAKAINDVITEQLDDILKTCDVIHITGTGKKKDIVRAGYWASEMAAGQLAHFYAAADIAISRASASMMTELAANAVPKFLIPIRGLSQDHPCKNTIKARDNGGCVLLLQEEMQEKLISEISRILADDGLRSQMSKKITTLYEPNATVRIAKIIASCVASRKNLP